jgi:alkylhydroperoxidase family enzyme
MQIHGVARHRNDTPMQSFTSSRQPPYGRGTDMVHIQDWSTTTHRQRGMASNLETLGEALAEFASESSGTSIPSKLRELLILHTAWRTQSECLWNGHLEAAIAAGITDLQLAAIQQGKIEAYVFSPKEKSVLRFLSRAKGFMTLRGEHLDDLKAHCDEREIADILTIASLYHMIAMLASRFEPVVQPHVVY